MEKTFTYQEMSVLLEGVDIIEVEACTDSDDNGVRLERVIIFSNAPLSSKNISLQAPCCKYIRPHSQRMLTWSLSSLLDGLWRRA